MISQRVVGLSVSIVCTAYILYGRRHFIWSLFSMKGMKYIVKDSTLEIENWSAAYSALKDDAYSESAELHLLNIIKQASSDSLEARQALADVTFFGTRHITPDYAAAFDQYQALYKDHGLISAAHMLAIYHAEGIGIPIDPAKALVLHTLAARTGHFPAQLTLAHWYSVGLHVQTDCAQARSYYFDAAKVVEQELLMRKRKYRSIVPPESLVDKKKRGNVMAMFPSKDLIEYYRYSADKGQTESQTILGQVHYHGGADWDPDYPAAFSFFEAAARQGGSVAQGYLGQMHLRGEGAAQSNHLAYLHFKISAEGGSAMGLNGMGMCYWKGIEVVQDYEEALNFFEKAILKDNQESLYNAAMMLKEWDHTLYADQIVSFLMRAVKSGHVASHYELAKSYGRQPGFCSLALYLLKTYVEKGDESYLLDQAYSFYKDGKTNQAISRYLFMAGQGFEVAQSNIAYILDKYDRNRAVVWWNRSSLQGNYKSRVRVGDFFSNHFSSKLLGLAASAAHYVSAAMHKEAQGSYNMGIAYNLGQGTWKDQGLSDLFFDDCVRYETKAEIAVSLTRKMLKVYSFLKKYGHTLLLIISLWIVLFACLLGLVLLHEHLENLRKMKRYNPVVSLQRTLPETVANDEINHVADIFVDVINENNDPVEDRQM